MTLLPEFTLAQTVPQQTFPAWTAVAGQPSEYDFPVTSICASEGGQYSGPTPTTWIFDSISLADVNGNAIPNGVTVGNAPPNVTSDVNYITLPQPSEWPTKMPLMLVVSPHVRPGVYALYVTLSFFRSGPALTGVCEMEPTTPTMLDPFIIFGHVLPPTQGMSITVTVPPTIPSSASVQQGKVLTHDDLTLTVTDGTGMPVSGAMVAVQSDRPSVDAITQPASATDSNGVATASVETRDQPGPSTITSATEGISTRRPGIIPWLPAHYQSGFLVTCYVTSDERDFLNTPLISGVRGLPSTNRYHQGFISDIVRQGSGRALDGTIVQYSAPTRSWYIPTSPNCPKTSIGACAVDGTTSAVDPSVVPRSNTSTIGIDGVGNRIAQDGGAWIHAYHIDVYYGLRRRDCIAAGAQSNVSVNYVSY